MNKHLAIGWLIFGVGALAQAGSAPPPAPTDPAHPGSKIYSYTFSETDISCGDRNVSVFLPGTTVRGQTFPVVVYGHGQALELDAYRATFEHLAKKGVAVIFPAYDTGFFDQEWDRMASDYVALTGCALAHFPALNADQVIYSGHSKGAYVAGIAAGTAGATADAASKPRSIILFEPAGADDASLATIDPRTSMTVIFADHDSTVSSSISEKIYSGAASARKQLIYFKSYEETTPVLTADHFWPLTENTLFGGGPENSFHYYGAWKWLVAAAWDLQAETHFTNPFLFGDEALDKGLPGLRDTAKRNYR